MMHVGSKDQENPWKLWCEYLVTGPNGFRANIAKGFSWDMASVPWLFRRILPKAHPQMVRAATLHDWLYANKIGTKEAADQHFFNVLKQDGLDRFRRNAAYQAVKRFGRSAWND